MMAGQKSLTPKQRAFAMAYVETGNASEAYRLAYNAEAMAPETVNRKAYDLLQNGHIAAMVASLQGEHKERHKVTVDSLIDELEEARTMAIDEKQAAAAVAATVAKGRMMGLDKTVVGVVGLAADPTFAAAVAQATRDAMIGG